MKISQRGPADTDLSQLVHNDKTVNQRRDAEVKSQQHAESAKVNISDKARELQKIGELARTGDALRAEKVRQIKEQIAAGEYKVAPAEVAKSILRGEVTRLLKDD